jgi:hypothetical protein
MSNERIKKIRNQQRIEERRNPEFYRTIDKKFAWIHSMLCLYLQENGHSDDSDINNIENIVTHLEQFENALRWHYTRGVDEWIEKIKNLLHLWTFKTPIFMTP